MMDAQPDPGEDSAELRALRARLDAGEMWQAMDAAERRDIILQYYAPVQWFEPEPLGVLAHFRHRPPGRWGVIRATFRDLGGNPHDLEREVDKLLNENTPEVKPAAVGSQPHLHLTKLGNLFKEPEEAVEWLVNGLLPESGLSLLVAKPKVGKSTLARNLALHVAQGQDFLGRTTQQGPVVYLALEEKRTEVRKHFQDMGATGEEEIYVNVASAPADGLQQLRREADRLKPVLIIIDPLFRLTRVKDGNDYA